MSLVARLALEAVSRETAARFTAGRRARGDARHKKERRICRLSGVWSVKAVVL